MRKATKMIVYYAFVWAIGFLLVWPVQGQTAAANAGADKNKKAKAEGSQSADSDLARVAILNFKNNTGDKNLVWITTNLPENIFESMKKKFEFVRTDPKKAQKIADKLNPGNRKFRKSEIVKIAKQSDSDIVIYGDFFMNKQTNQLEFTAHVFHVEGGKDIGVAHESSPLDNTIFMRIENISRQIINFIYKFALKLEAEAETKKPTRIMVLVPTWKTAEERAKAEAELKTMKDYMSQKYEARFITIFEFYEERKIPPKERKKVNRYAKKRQKKKIIQWLDKQGVKDAFIILVQKNDVSITPVVAGKTEETSTYAAGSKPEEKFKVFVSVSKKAKMEPKKEEKKKVTLTKETMKKGPTTFGILWRTAVMPGWGHLYAGQKRGYGYLGAWGASVLLAGGTTTIFFIDKKTYENADKDFDRAYNDYRNSKRAMSMSMYILGASYAATFLDLAVSGDMFPGQKKSNPGFLGELWRNLLVPGWGQMAAGRDAGFYYYGFWAMSGTAAGIAALNRLDLRKEYRDTKGDYDLYYNRFDEASRQASAASWVFAASYSAPLLDSLVHGPLDFGSADYIGGFWRNAVMPGWGQLSRKEERGGIYLSTWSMSGVFFLWSHLYRNDRKSEYDKATSDFDTKYNRYKTASLIRGVSSYVFIATYVIALVDTAITGKAPAASGKSLKAALGGWQLTTAMLPETGGTLAAQFRFIKGL